MAALQLQIRADLEKEKDPFKVLSGDITERVKTVEAELETVRGFLM